MKRKEFLNTCANVIGGVVLWPEVRQSDDESKIERFKNKYEFEYLYYRKIVEDNDILEDFKKLTKEERVEDFDLYFYIYMAGQEKYGVPWYFLMLIHEHETSASRNPSPEIRGNIGGMQRSPVFYDQAYVDDAVLNYEFLSLLPQRYSKSKGFRSNDFEEIMFAAKKISLNAKSLRNDEGAMTYEDSILTAQFKYCSNRCAKARVSQYNKIKNLFQNDDLFSRRICETEQRYIDK